METVKLHLLAAVIATQAVALYDGAVPFFPIEISRTAASSPRATNTLATGFATLIVTMIYTKTLDAVTFSLWLGLMVIALVPDSVSWTVHMLGVVALVAAACAHVYRRRQIALVPPLLCALAIYGIRIVFKLVLLFTVDKQVIAAAASNKLSIAFERSMDIMMRGPLAYNNDPELWNLVGPTFKICGVLQWAAFFALSFVF